MNLSRVSPLLLLLLCTCAARAALAQGALGDPPPYLSVVAPPDRGEVSQAQVSALERRLRELEQRLQTAPPAPPAPVVADSSRRAPGAEKGAPASALPAPAGEPFAWGDFTWLNGNNRQRSALLDTKYFTGSFMLDAYYTYSFNNPIDNTLVGSTSTARHNELQINMVSIGGDFHYKGARASLTLQLGMRSTVVPRNDFSVNRGQFDLANVYRYVREAYAGYHWDVLHGINLDAGIFMSYIGLFSYNNFENWSYQPSYTSDNTPWFFNGLRLQIFPTDRLKVELWLTNGWQSYAKFGSAPSFGYQLLWRPREWLNLVTNGYIGNDTLNTPDRLRFHSDNSVLVRYLERPGSFFRRAAISVTCDLGFESGGGVTPFGGDGGPAQHFLSAMAYHRLWLWRERFAVTVGGGVLDNPGRYLVLLPTGVAGQRFDTSIGTEFKAWDVSSALDFMPNDESTWRLEVVHREANVPYFAGPAGVSAPDGLNTTAISPDYRPALVKSETRIIAALLFRM